MSFPRKKDGGLSLLDTEMQSMALIGKFVVRCVSLIDTEIQSMGLIGKFVVRCVTPREEIVENIMKS